jgi:hypothetical protein
VIPLVPEFIVPQDGHDNPEDRFLDGWQTDTKLYFEFTA